MSLSIKFLLCEFLVLLVALDYLLFLVIVLIFLLIWTLDNDMFILATIVAHPFSSCLLFPISLERSSFAYEFIEFLDQ
jgi:hypothetical protein